ncbi:hypothetical protein AB0C29_20095 [Actinoplanes sp. NPDC048791]|uniref:hypothetical protein n=1 Tax=Actinoplanes sp. NPDC048791 TaxID=3154623 RepID=UPI00340732D4
MPGPVRSHRRANPLIGALLVGGMVFGLLIAVVLLRVAMLALSDVFGGIGFLVVIGVISVTAIGRASLQGRRRQRAADELRHWERTAGWEPAPWRWPWQSLVRWPETVTVLRAYAKRVDGFAVRTGLLEFDDNGLGTTVDRRSGRAAFAIVALPRPVPSMGVRVHRLPGRLRDGEDEFLHRFQPVGADTERLGDPLLRAAHLRGDIPPWTVIGEELFAFVPLDAPLRPDDLEKAVGKAIRVVRLLGLAVEVGEHG